MNQSRAKTYKPADFSIGGTHEMLLTLGKLGFSPEMAKQIKNPKTGRAEKIIELFSRTMVSVSGVLEIREEDLMIDAVDGKRTISEAEDVFDYHIDPGFKRRGITQKGKASKETHVITYDVIKDASLLQMFKSFSVDLDRLCLTQDQIINFCKKYGDCWLPYGGKNLMFFLFKSKEHFFVAGAFDMNSPLETHPNSQRGLGVMFNRLDENVCYPIDEWEHRVVVPQLIG